MATDQNDISATVLAYDSEGFRVIPLFAVDEHGVCTCQEGEDCRSQGKHPISNGWQKAQRTSRDYLPRMMQGRNVGIATGSDSGFFVVDIDPDADGLKSARAWAFEYAWDSNATRRVKTGSGGFHLYYRQPDFRVANSVSKIAPGIDIRGEGGQVVAPPSRTNKGDYRLVNDVPIIDAPEWLLEKLRPEPPKERKRPEPRSEPAELGDGETARLRAYSEGAVANEKRRLAELAVLGWDKPWNVTTFEVACNLIQLANTPWSHIDIDEAYAIVFDESPAREAGYTDDVINRTFESAKNTIGDKVTPMPEDVSASIDFMFGEDVTEDPKGPGVEEPLETEETEAVGSFFGIPVDGDILDPMLPAKEAAARLGKNFSSAVVNREVVEVVCETANFIALPLAAEGDTSVIDAWIGAAIRSGTADLFWTALGYLLSGQDSVEAQVGVRGAGEILKLITAAVRPPVGDDVGALHFGPTLKTLSGGDIVIEFADIPLELDEADVPAIAFRAIAAWRNAGALQGAEAAEIETTPTYDTRGGKMRRKRTGQSVGERGEGDEFYVEA